jgi:hypothetical protein
MASFGGLNRKRMHGSAISSTQKRIKICVYDKPPRVGAPSRGFVRALATSAANSQTCARIMTGDDCVRVCMRAQDEISMHEFEQFALDRMRVLKAIDAAKAKGMKPDEMRTTVDKLCAQYLPLRDDLGPFGEQDG